MRDKRERVDSEKAARAAAQEKKEQGTAEKLAARTNSKGRNSSYQPRGRAGRVSFV